MKRLLKIAILIFLFSTKPAWAANELAVKVESKYNSLSSWSADFVQETFVDILGRKLVKPGKITVARPNKLHIEYSTDPRKVYASDGKKLWVYKTNDVTAEQFDNPKKIISKEALSFLSGLRNLSEIFTLSSETSEPVTGLQITNKSLKRLYLVPKDTNAVVVRIVLGVDPKTLAANEALIFNSSGNVTHYTFKNIVFDGVEDENLFVLPKEPKRKIIHH